MVKVQLAPGAAHKEERIKLLVAHWAEGHADLALAGTRHHIVKVNARLQTNIECQHKHVRVTHDTQHIMTRNTSRTHAGTRRTKQECMVGITHVAERGEGAAWPVIEASDRRAERDGLHQHRAGPPVAFWFVWVVGRVVRVVPCRVVRVVSCRVSY